MYYISSRKYIEHNAATETIMRVAEKWAVGRTDTVNQEPLMTGHSAWGRTSRSVVCVTVLHSRVFTTPCVDGSVERRTTLMMKRVLCPL